MNSIRRLYACSEPSWYVFKAHKISYSVKWLSSLTVSSSNAPQPFCSPFPPAPAQYCTELPDCISSPDNDSVFLQPHHCSDPRSCQSSYNKSADSGYNAPIFSSLNPALIPTRIQFLCLFQRIFGFINTIQAKFFRKKLVQIFNRNLFPCLECHDVGIAFCTASTHRNG